MNSAKSVGLIDIPIGKPTIKELQRLIRQTGQITKDMEKVMYARIKSKGVKKDTIKFLAEKYGEEKAKDLVERYFNSFDSTEPNI